MGLRMDANKIKGNNKASTLRQLAEKALEKKLDKKYDLVAKSSEDIASLIHELQVHQIELEMQNDELRRVQVELENARDKYSHLYDFAPVGYLTISDKGIILEANLTCSNMLGIERRSLIGMPFSHFIIKEDQDIFYLNRMKLIETKSKQVFELRIMKKGGIQFYSQLECITTLIDDSDQIQIRIVISDVSDRKEAREMLDRNVLELKQRVKELNCLYKISKIREVSGISLEETLQKIVDILPPSWLYPDIACARIILDGKEYRSKNFKETEWEQSARIVINNKPVGTVAVFYLKEMPQNDEGPFRKEERNLINAITERVGKTAAHMYLAANLRIERDNLVNILSSMEDGVYIAGQEHEIQYLNPALEKEFGPVGEKKCFEYFDDRKDQCPLCTNQDVFAGKTVHREWYCAKNQKTYDLIATPLRNSDGSLSKLEIFRDITEFREIQKKLQTAYDDLEKKVEKRTAEIMKAKEDAVKDKKNTEAALFEIKKLKDQLEAERAYLQDEIKLEYNHENIIGKSDGLNYVLYKIEQIAGTDTNVLVLGETGTGKELVARAIHSLSHNKNRAMVKVNCATLPSNLIESELFGHEKGAFTGAHSRHLGRFEVAHGTTIFLDEIGELPLELQSKLLRVIQDGEFERLGSSHTVKVKVRIIAATNRNLEEEVKKGRFREDLWYRLNVFPITMPPLRDRLGDIPLLVEYYIKKISKRMGKSIEIIPANIMETLQKYSWPGNIRELENVLERAVINSSGPKLRLVDDLQTHTKYLSTPQKTLEAVDRDHLLQILDQTKWKISGKNGAAEILGLNRSTLRARMRKLGIVKP